MTMVIVGIFRQAIAHSLAADDVDGDDVGDLSHTLLAGGANGMETSFLSSCSWS